MSKRFVPLYMQIASQIKERIIAEEYPSGTRLPNESYFMEKFGCSRVTIRHAFDELIRNGYVKRIPHKGYYANKNKFSVVQSSSFNHIFESDCDDFNISHEILSFGTESADENLAAVFGCQEGTPLYHLKVLRKQNNDPFVFQETYLRVSMLPKLNIFLLKDHTLHDIIENHYHYSISHIHQLVSVVRPNEEQGLHLHAASTDSLLQVTDTLFVKGAQDCEVIRYGTATYAMNVNYQYSIYAK